MSKSHVLPQEGFVRLPVVLEVLGVKKSYFWEEVRRGKFPKPIKLAARVSVWKVEDIRKLISDISASALVEGEKT